MPNGHFDPLPEPEYDFDLLRRWLSTQEINMSKLTAGILVGGDIHSSNWDGSIPADLTTSEDSGATVGYYLDGSAGAAQFMGDMHVGGDVVLMGSGRLLTEYEGGDAGMYAALSAASGAISWYENDGLGGSLLKTQLGYTLASGSRTDTAYMTGPLEFPWGSSPQITFTRGTATNDTGIGGDDTQIGLYVAGAEVAHFDAGGLDMFQAIAMADDKNLVFGTSSDWAMRYNTGDARLYLYAVPSTGTYTFDIFGNGSSIVNMTLDGSFYPGDGTAAVPSIGFDGDNDTGMYLYGIAELGFTLAGSHIARFTGTRLTGDSTGEAAVIFGANGTAAAPSFTWAGDLDTGMYRTAANSIGFSIGGTLRWYINSSGNLVGDNAGNYKVFAGNGTASNPSHSFINDTDAGMWKQAAGVLAIQVDSTDYIYLQTDGYFRFFAASVERFRVSPDGYIYQSGSRHYFGGISADDYIAHSSGTWYVATDNANMITHTPAGGLTVLGTDPYTSGHAWITADSASTGGDNDDQMAGLSVGESGFKGSAAVHLVYTGDGKAHLGMGTVTTGGSGDPLGYRFLQMAYNSHEVYLNMSNAYFEDSYYNATAYGNVRQNGKTNARVSQNSYSSKREYKRNIKTHTIDNSPFLGYRPVTYRYRNHPDLKFIDDLSKTELKYGFVLEEVMEAGIAEKRIEQHPVKGGPHGLYYESWIEELVADHTALVQDYLGMKQRVVELERRLEILEAA